MKLSVIIPVYNVEIYLRECIDSVRNQTYHNLEIILVDDGSTDGSGEICDEYAGLDRRINVVHKQNGGLVSARKAGIRVATGELVANIDGDDYIEPEMFEGMIRRMLIEEADVVQCAYRREDDRKEAYGIIDFVANVDDELIKDIITDWLKWDHFKWNTSIINKIYFKDLFRDVYEEVPDNMSHGEDKLFSFKILNRLKKISAMDSVFYHYRIRYDSIAHSSKHTDFLVKQDMLVTSIYYEILHSCPQITKDVMDRWILKEKSMLLKNCLKSLNVNVPFYRFPDVLKLFKRKIIIYGAGVVGRDFVMQLSEYEDIDIVKWVDRNFQNISYSFRKVESVEHIKNCEFDYIVIAVNDIKLAEQIKEELIAYMDVAENQILWKYGDIVSIL